MKRSAFPLNRSVFAGALVAALLVAPTVPAASASTPTEATSSVRVADAPGTAYFVARHWLTRYPQDGMGRLYIEREIYLNKGYYDIINTFRPVYSQPNPDDRPRRVFIPYNGTYQVLVVIENFTGLYQIRSHVSRWVGNQRLTFSNLTSHSATRISGNGEDTVWGMKLSPVW